MGKEMSLVLAICRATLRRDLRGANVSFTATKQLDLIIVQSSNYSGGSTSNAETISTIVLSPQGCGV